MRRLLLLRHGQAEARAHGGGDHGRKLTDLGRADAAAVARALAERGLRPTQALVSSAARTVETWEAAAPAFPEATPHVQRLLYDADAERLWSAFEESNAESVLIVGHNPGLHVLATRLAQRAAAQPGLDADLNRLSRDFPPAACAAFAVSGGKAALEAVIFPQDVRDS